MRFHRIVKMMLMGLDFLQVSEDFQMLYGFYPTVMIFESDI